jgi:hypothetical protein
VREAEIRLCPQTTTAPTPPTHLAIVTLHLTPSSHLPQPPVTIGVSSRFTRPPLPRVWVRGHVLVMDGAVVLVSSV